MDISVLIPVCNKENVEYFKMALDSIINQTYQAKEIVIVKDGILSDDLNKTINSYITEFPNFIHSYQLNKCRCLGEVLRYGVEKCKYDYIARMDADDVSVTITTRFDTPASGKFMHPYLNRAITVREAARIQSFPDTFHFYGTKTSQMKQVGNAVPPLLAQAVAKAILKDMEMGCHE